MEAAPSDVREWWRVRLGTGEAIGEQEGLRLLADYGIPTVEVRVAATAEEAIRAAEDLGYPVVLKTAAPEIHHKIDAAGVRLGLDGGQEVSMAYVDMAARLGPHVTVAKMAAPGVEMALGIVHDATFGPLVLVAAGGVLVELLHDRRLGLPPLDESSAMRMIDALRIRPLLDGARGSDPADVAALARAVSRLSVLAVELGDLIAELDANPVIVSPTGCLAVDALVVPRSANR